MAEVHVTSWSQFLSAIQVSGDTVHCPEDAIWDMNELEPDGHIGNIRFDCDNVYGHNTTIKNLRYNGRIIFKDGFGVISDLHFENMVVDTGNKSEIFFLDRQNRPNENEMVQMNLCRISGYFTNAGGGSQLNEQYFAKGIRCYRCGFNIELPLPGRFNLPGVMEYCNFVAQLPQKTAIDVNYGYNWRINYRFSNIVIVAPNLTSDQSFAGAVCCVFRGRKERLTGLANVDTSYPSLYCTTDMAAVTDAKNVVGVTEAQLRDAAYLQSIGFPIGVD